MKKLVQPKLQSAANNAPQPHQPQVDPQEAYKAAGRHINKKNLSLGG